MEYDHVAEEKQDHKFAAWLKLFLSKQPEYLAIQLVKKHILGKPQAACRWKNGAFNICYRVRYEDGRNVIVRFAALGRVIQRREKVRHEVATMNHLRHHTSLPIPEVLGSGICWAGPYIIMPFIEGKTLSDLLKGSSERPSLNLDISDRGLNRAYRELAMIVLKLSQPEFDTIGTLEMNATGEISVVGRPFTFSMNELMALGNLPPNAFPTCTYKTASDYFETLAKQHLTHLRLQKHDAAHGEEDCQRKFTARCLFLDVVRTEFAKSRGPFRLYCDDLRPSNVIMDLDRFCVSAVIDWEFTYVAPVELSAVAPWWLLLESPEDWEPDLDEFLARYSPKLSIFLDALRDGEDELIAKHTLRESQRLSPHMEQSMHTGLFWICLAARYGTMFDEIYW